MLAGTFNASNGTLTAVVNGSVYTVDKTHGNYDGLLSAYKSGSVDQFINLYSKTKTEVVLEKIVTVGKGLEFVDGKLSYNGNPVHHTYLDRIIAARKEGFPIDPMLKFLENWLQNPSARAKDEGPDFLANRNLPITEDGCFLAYKSVGSDWYSKASGNLTLLSGKTNSRGQIYNAVGEVIECLRNEVHAERSNECSKGLHVGGLDYSGPSGWYHSSGDKVVICKVNPKDVVSVPKDHNAQKVRVCKYEVVEEFKKPLVEHHVGVEANMPDVVDEFHREVTIDNVMRLDSVAFLYQGKNDLYPKQRYLLVEEVTEDYLFGTVLPEDPSYEEGNETRKFNLENIMDLMEFDPDECDCDDYDDDCDDCDCDCHG